MSGGEARPSAEMVTRHRRIGRWVYGNHEGLNPGWRLDETNLVLDFDPLDSSGSLRGQYVLWTDGRTGDPIDHYLDGAMEYVEVFVARFDGYPATTD